MIKKTKLELDMETADRITVLNLMDSLNYMTEENKELLKSDVMEDYKKADYEYNLRMCFYIREVLKHYGVE